MNNEFCRELRDLLQKYDASISFEVDECSDLYGISGERIEISNKHDVLLSVDGYCILANDIKIEE